MCVGSIAILVDGQPTTTAVTDHLAFELDLAQYDAGEGPCLTALGGQTVRFAVLDESERFPHFAIGAADRRIRSVLSTPIRHDDDIIGTLNLYSRQPDGFDEQAQRVADVTAAEAGTAIKTSRIYEQARQRRDELQAVHDEEAEISQAQGALMAVQLCSAEQAIGLLAHAVGCHRRRPHRGRPSHPRRSQTTTDRRRATPQQPQAAALTAPGTQCFVDPLPGGRQSTQTDGFGALQQQRPLVLLEPPLVMTNPATASVS